MSDQVTRVSAARLALQARQARERAADVEAVRSEPIAIVGLGCRFPGGAFDPDGLWRLLAGGVDAVREVSRERFDVDVFFDPDQNAPGKVMTREGGFLENIDAFDAAFFGIAPREASLMDPQQRMLLEVAWEALEDAGLTARRLEGSRTGVFVAIYNHDYLRYQYADPDRVEAYTSSGTAYSIAAGRLAYLYDLRGPAVVVDTACSSSLVAVHEACQSLRSGECDAAVVGGSGLVLGPETGVSLSRFGMLSRDGRCKTFDASADGFGRGEGCGVVVLKRLADALAAGDRVRAVVRGSALNQDGRSTAMTAPNGLAQREVIREALSAGRVSPGDIGYVEAHGTGTPLGDPIEVEALAEVVGAGSRPCAIGSIKANVGHLEAAAGVAGLIKAVLVLEHEAIPPQVHFKALNPHVSLDGTRLFVPTEITPWPRGEAPRFAGISAFGFSGTNAHAVIEEAPRLPDESPTREGASVLALTARHPDSLRELARAHAVRLGGERDYDWRAVCRTAAARRTHHEVRLAAVGDSAAALRGTLEAYARGEAPSAAAGAAGVRGAAPRVAFVFCGQGPQRHGMGRMLFDQEPVFRAALERCEGAIRAEAGWSVIEEMSRPETETRLAQTEYAQPALFALHVALAELWRSWGVIPAAVLGHSVGEVAAAHLAGILTLEEAARVIVLRGRLMQRATGFGRMASLELDEEATESLLAGRAGVCVGAVNGPRSTVVSGDPEAVEALLREAEAKGVGLRRLPVDYAFHSPQMDPIVPELAAGLTTLRPRAGAIPMFSSTTGEPARGPEIDGAHFGRNVRVPVRFAQAIAHALRAGIDAFVEIGPHPVLASAIAQCVGEGMDVSVLASLRRDRPERATMLAALSALWCRGAEPDWEGALGRARVVDLPRYPWKHERFHVPAPFSASARGVGAAPKRRAGAHPLLGSRLRTALPQTIFESEIGDTEPALLADHRLAGASVVPAAGIIEVALAAARDRQEAGPLVVADLEVSRPLVVADGERQTLQTVLDESAAGDVPLVLHSAAAGSDAWTVQASARILQGPVPDRPDAPGEDLEALRRRLSETWNGESFYRELAGIGPEFGPRFRGVERVWVGSGEALGEVVAPEVVRREARTFVFHPGLLDSCLQTAAGALPNRASAREAGEVFLPVAVDRVLLLRVPGDRLWTHARLRSEGGPVLAVDLRILTEEGLVVARIDGLRFQRTALGAIARATQGPSSGWQHTVEWRRVDALPTPAAAGAPWLLIGDRTDQVTRLARALEARGARVHLHGPGEKLDQVMAAAGSLAGVVDLTPLTVGIDEHMTANAVQAAALRACRAALDLAKAIASAPGVAPTLVLVTRGSQAAGPRGVTQPHHAALWGLRAVVALENPAARCRAIDLDPEAPGGEAEALADELLSADAEDEVAHRGGERRAARLVPYDSPAHGTQGPTHAVELFVRERGLLESLTLRPQERRAPGPGDVEIELRATGLNFRDVLNTLGLYPGEAGPLGDEGAGVVRTVGPGVREFLVGDPVMGFAPGSFRSFVTVPASLVVRKPAELSFEEAAAVPVAFLTAEHAFDALAALRPGQTVLIHAAAGGVGLAAVSLAQERGATIFATAGSEAKRDYLRSLGVPHVMDSRSLAFAEEVLALTSNQGVDVVLNSLAGEFIPASLGVTRRGGTFVEIGRTGVWPEEQVAALNRDIRYHVLFLGDLRRTEPEQLRQRLTALAGRLAEGRLRLPPVRAFRMESAEDAFRFMAQARHIGKIVVTHAGASARGGSGGTCLVTGGFGGLGLRAARSLADSGVRALVLLGRRPPGETVLAAAREMEGRGVTVRMAEADVSDGPALEAALATALDGLPPLRGVVHAAGTLDDAVLLDQDARRFEVTFAPKVAGAWNLHRLTRHRSLDFFVLFSAGAALLGSPAQANYAAANAVLDALASYRRAQGLCALSIDWGAWSGVGMAARLDERDRRRMAERGLGTIAPDEGGALLVSLLGSPRSRVAVLPVRWDRYLRASGERTPRLLQELAGARGTAAADAEERQGRPLVARLREAPESRRRGLLLAHVQRLAVRVLGVAPDAAIDPMRPLREMGLDSLMAVELRNVLARDIETRLPATLLFDHPTLDGLTDYLLAAVPGLRGEGRPGPDAGAPAHGIASLSEDEAERALLDELQSLRGGDRG